MLASAVSFGPFRLLPAQRLLLEADRPLRLGSRALAILVALVERAGELVSKDELIARVWPNTIVDEGSLRVHMAALRRTLGDGQPGKRYVATVPGRGYSFVAPLATAEPARSPAPSPPVAEPVHNLPAPLTRTVGRADAVQSIVAQLPRQRFVTVVGPGGIGKATVAVTAAEALISGYRDGVRFVDLGALSGPQHVPSALASMLGLASLGDDPVPALIAFLCDKQMLIVLDSCEHVVQAAAALAVGILRGAPGVHILATSREPLRADGERLHRLAALAVPPAADRLTAAEALAFPAVQLFVERAAASVDGYELSDADAPLVAEICRRLDGMALAIELAAGRIDVFGVRELAARLDDRLRLLTYGRRTAQPRHQALGAALDWSYEFLPEPERRLLRRLAVFAGEFTLEAVSAVAGDDGIAAADAIDLIANLVTKSLVTADVASAVVHYRLLDTTRAYALDKLVAGGEFAAIARRHAAYCQNLFERAKAECETRPPAEWLSAYGRQIGSVRAALDWAFSDAGDTALGVDLTIAAVPLWMRHLLVDECRRRVERALAAPEACRGARRDMQLFAALGSSMSSASGGELAMEPAWTNALALAESLDDPAHQLRALWGLWGVRLSGGRCAEALAQAQRLTSIAPKSPVAHEALIGARMTGHALHFLGDQAGARLHIERMLGHYVPAVRQAHTFRFQVDQPVTARITLANVLWLQGFPDQAMRTVEANVEDALSIDHPLSLLNALAKSVCPVAIWTGNLAAAARFIDLFREQSTRHGLRIWHTIARCFEGVLCTRRGDLAAGLVIVRTALGELPESRFALPYMAIAGDLAEALGKAGDVAAGMATIDSAIERAERDGERWCLAELLRIKGELTLLADRSNVAAAEDYFWSALRWARQQQVLSWELRAAMSMARLWAGQENHTGARDLLAPVRARFTEGFDTGDLRAAAALLEQLASPAIAVPAVHGAAAATTSAPPLRGPDGEIAAGAPNAPARAARRRSDRRPQ